MLLYGGIIGILIFLGETRNHDTKFLNKKTGKFQRPSYIMHFRAFVFKEPLFSAVILFCLIVSVVLGYFLSYHLDLAVKNQTTNEEYKFEMCSNRILRELKIVK